MEKCPHHADAKKCEANARALLTKLDSRASATEAIETTFWGVLDRLLREGWGAEFLEENDPCDCWKGGGLPMPSLTRSALLFHWKMPSGKTPAELATDADFRACPVLREFLAAQMGARLSFFRVGRETRKGLELVDAANGEKWIVDSPFSKGWMEAGYLLFGRVFTFRGRSFLGESEGMPLAHGPADEAERQLRRLAPGDPERTAKLFDIFYESELTGLETEVTGSEEDDAEEFLLRKGGNLRN